MALMAPMTPTILTTLNVNQGGIPLKELRHISMLE